MDSGPFILYTGSAEYILHKESSPEILYIDRSVFVLTKKVLDSPIQTKGERCFGLLGLIQLYSSAYLIIIKEALHVAWIKDSFVYMIKSVEFRPCNSINLDSPEHINDKQTISLLKSLIESESFYFSYDYDLTLNVQAIANLTQSSKKLNKYERADEKYFWNKHLSESIIKANAHDYVVVVVNGFIKGESVEIKGRRCDYIIISRRDKRRTGTRFNTRGLDDQGNAVNYVETEQLLLAVEDDHLNIYSHIQIRGSIPLIWQQKPNLSWTPRPKILNSAQQNTSAGELHFNELFQNYGGVCSVNLIDKKGSQKTIGTAFTSLSNLISAEKKDRHIQYVWFDFHHECRNMKYENLRALLYEINKSLEDFGWCEVIVKGSDYVDNGKIVKSQNGVFRTNCMDCLDRTNVVQSVIARNVLFRQLASAGLSGPPNGEAFQPFGPSLELKFRDLWVKNADNMSILYSGTPAQKTDFTRLGKRTLQGMAFDGIYSVTRFVINNFLDGSKQNSIDLLLGKLAVKKDVPMRPKFKSLYNFLALVVFLLLFIYYFSLKGQGFMFWVMFILGLSLTGSLVKSYGTMLVDKPINN